MHSIAIDNFDAIEWQIIWIALIDYHLPNNICGGSNKITCKQWKQKYKRTNEHWANSYTHAYKETCGNRLTSAALNSPLL